MTDKLFVIAIGGTGMRCLESFVNLCAIGMFDGQEIDILTIDTDNGNGNKDRTESLIELYNDIKSTPGEVRGGNPNRNTFFSAKLNLFKFATDYSDNRVTYRNLANIAEKDDDNQDLADLFLDSDTVQSFNLSHGYRAQTHLGSMLMYHGIVEAAKNATLKGDQATPLEQSLKEFVTRLMQAPTSRTFIFGSVFGGTGASSIPIVPAAIREAVKIISNGNNSLDPDSAMFGAALLTDYFSFQSPSADKLKTEKVIADSNNFALNSQAALDFYRKDPTVKRFYRRLYHVGWPSDMRDDIGDGDNPTGGPNQKNMCHVVELMCACAAYEFFTNEDINRIDGNDMPCFYRTVATDEAGRAFIFTADSFVDASLNNAARIFEEKLAQFLSFANVVLASQGAASADTPLGLSEFIERITATGNNSQFKTIEQKQLKEIEEYLRRFAFSMSSNTKAILPGWLYQIKNSVKSGKFIFSSDAFISDANQMKDLAKNPGKVFDDKSKNWSTSGFSGLLDRNAYSNFVDTLRKDTSVSGTQNVSRVKEQFIAYMYNAIRKRHNFAD